MLEFWPHVHPNNWGMTLVMFVTDVVILTLPMRPQWGLKVLLRERVSLVGLFGLGGEHPFPICVHDCQGRMHPSARACVASRERREECTYARNVEHTAMSVSVRLSVSLLRPSA